MIDTEVVVCDSVINEVTATGVVQPVYKVTVGTQVSGIVKHLYADYNDKVRRGDLLAELDKSLLQEELNVSRAQLSVATSQKNLAQKNFDRVKGPTISILDLTSCMVSVATLQFCCSTEAAINNT